MPESQLAFVAATHLRIAAWHDEDGAAVFNTRTGDIHVVNLIGQHLLQSALRQPSTLESALESVHAAFDIDPELEIDAHYMRQLLHEMAQQGLVYRFLS